MRVTETTRLGMKTGLTVHDGETRPEPKPTLPKLSEERSMPDEESPVMMTTDRLFATYISPDRKVLDLDSFKAALVKALSDAYERGLQDGLVTKTTGPDA
jgi:hypothetical protein